MPPMHSSPASIRVFSFLSHHRVPLIDPAVAVTASAQGRLPMACPSLNRVRPGHMTYRSSFVPSVGGRVIVPSAAATGMFPSEPVSKSDRTRIAVILDLSSSLSCSQVFHS